MISIGNAQVGSVFFGNSRIRDIWLGNQLVKGFNNPTPHGSLFTFDGNAVVTNNPNNVHFAHRATPGQLTGQIRGNAVCDDITYETL